MADVVLNHVYKTYEGGSAAVKDFTLDIKDKEFVIFVGPSGCGKSTTLRMIAGLEEISDGELFIDGERMNEVESCDRDIAMVFQSYALYPHMTVFDNIAYSMKLKKLPKEEIKSRVHEAARTLGLEEILNRKPGQLSGGQKQRVAMGRAIVRQPKVFLMDEPLSNLDAKLRTQMRMEILKLYRKLETTFIYVTHDQTEAMTLGTKIVVLKDGVIQQVDTPQRLYERPANRFVAGFIGSPQMNFIDALCRVRKSGVTLEFGNARLPVAHGQAKLLEEQGYDGRTLTIGIRPEHVYLADGADGLEAEVKVCEMLGAETYLYFEYAGAQITARVEGKTPVRKGENVTFALDMERAHLFDCGTGKAIR